MTTTSQASQKEFVESILRYLRHLRKAGQDVVPIAGVITNLEALEKIISEQTPPVSAEMMAQKIRCSTLNTTKVRSKPVIECSNL